LHGRQGFGNLFFRPRLRAQVICFFRLKTASFTFFTLLFYSCVKGEKNRYTTATMLCMDDTLHKEDVLMIFGKLEVQNSHL